MLSVGFYAYFEPMSYSADDDPNSVGFNVHRGYEADLLSALEALDGVGLSFVRSGIAGWAEPGVVPIWRRAAAPEYDIVGGGITILDSRTRDAAGETIVAFTQPHVAFHQSLLVRSEDATRLADYAALASDVRVGALAGTTGEARLLQITGLADENGVLAAGTRVETPAGTVTADGSDSFRITSAQATANLEGRRMLHPPASTMPTVVYLGYESGESELLQALGDERIDAVARGDLGNRAAASADDRFVVTAVDAEAEDGGFAVDVANTGLLACLNDTILLAHQRPPHGLRRVAPEQPRVHGEGRTVERLEQRVGAGRRRRLDAPARRALPPRSLGAGRDAPVHRAFGRSRPDRREHRRRRVDPCAQPRRRSREQRGESP